MNLRQLGNQPIDQLVYELGVYPAAGGRQRAVEIRLIEETPDR